MVRMLKVVRVGDDIGLILPPDLVEYLGIKPGDEIEAEWIDSPEDSTMHSHLLIAKRIMVFRRDMLRRLAD